MTFVVSGRRVEMNVAPCTDAAPPVLATLRSIEARLQRSAPPPSDDLGETELPLTPDEAARLGCEGRNAAFEGMTLRSCPYAMSSRAKREAWIEGFNTLT